jgi:hypothetical protein
LSCDFRRGSFFWQAPGRNASGATWLVGDVLTRLFDSLALGGS